VSDGSFTPGVQHDLRLLVRCRGAQVRNLIDQHLRDAPWRTLAVVALLLAIWLALYVLLDHVLGHIRTWGLVGAVADQYVFVNFFLVLAVMLMFSNAILSFGSLFGRDEAQFLLSLPVHARAVVGVKWFEGMLLSSWSFLLLGVPLMMAVSSNTIVEWYYYPLFLAHFLGFIAIPACLGVLAAWAVAMWAPRRPFAVAVTVCCLVLLGVIYWVSGMSQAAIESEQWIRQIFRQIGVVKQPILPSTWTAKGIVAAMGRNVGESVFYLLVVAGNAAFLSWLTINIIGRTWPEAYSRAQQGRYHPTIRRPWFTAGLCWLLFFYLPPLLRRLMLKDLKAFARDARQWSQMLIMFGLLVVYVLNLSRLPVDLNNASTKGLIAFLNLTTISLILATFTSRFVYPLLSLESQQLWLLEMLPVRRTTMLLVKFLFALTVSVISAGGVMLLAVYILALPGVWARMNMAACIAVCIGLSGMAIGLGARFPVLGDRNPARIASGFGGTVNLVASMVFVALEMMGVAYLGTQLFQQDPAGLSFYFTPLMDKVYFGLLGLALLAAGVSLVIGARHFERLEA
jgi:ABC-2 type transport system permease protein